MFRSSCLNRQKPAKIAPCTGCKSARTIHSSEALPYKNPIIPRRTLSRRSILHSPLTPLWPCHLPTLLHTYRLPQVSQGSEAVPPA